MLIDSRLNLLESLPKDPLCTSLEVFVALSGALKYEDYVRVGPLVWDKCLNLSDTKAVINVCCFTIHLLIDSLITRLSGLLHLHDVRGEGTEPILGPVACPFTKVFVPWLRFKRYD